MTELIPITAATIGGEEVNAVNARELHAFLGNKDKFTTWITDRIEQFGFLEGQDFGIFSENSEKMGKGRPRKEYVVSISMAKELCMVERNAKGKRARLYFIECEKIAKQKTAPALQIPQSLPEALRLAANLAEQKMQLEAKVKEDAPKVEYYDQLQDAPGEITFTRFAKLIGIQRKRLIDWLRVNRYIYGVSNTPYQNRIEQGLLVLRNPEGKTHSDGTPVFAPYAHVTPKGAGSIYRRLLDEGIIKRNDQLELSFS